MQSYHNLHKFQPTHERREIIINQPFPHQVTKATNNLLGPFSSVHLCLSKQKTSHSSVDSYQFLRFIFNKKKKKKVQQFCFYFTQFVRVYFKKNKQVQIFRFFPQVSLSSVLQFCLLTEPNILPVLLPLFSLPS